MPDAVGAVQRIGMRGNEYKGFRGAGLASAVGLVLVISIAIGYFFGSWLDRVFGTGQVLMIIFTLLGIIAGFIEAITLAIRATKEE